MPVLRDIPIALTPDEIVQAQQSRRRTPRDTTAMVRAAAEAIEMAGPLYAPAIVYAEFEIQQVDDERVRLVDLAGFALRLSPKGLGNLPGFALSLSLKGLTVGPHADLLAPATRLLAAVYTLGPALEAQVEQLNRSGDMLAAYWLDTAGVMALGRVGQAVRCLAEERATAQRWGVSAALSPGSLVGWPLQGQRELCALLPLAEIGVRLNSRCVLEPHKSVSLVIGLGPGYDTGHVGSVCHLCALRDSCWRRK